MRHLFPLVSLLAMATPAMAQTIDEQGASALRDSLARYVGQTAFDKGVLKVGVDGDAYKLEFDMKSLAALLPAEAGVTATFSPYALRVKPKADGTWDVAGDVFPNGSVGIKRPDGTEQDMEITVTDGKFSGVFDPALATFSTATGSYGGLKMVTSDPMSRTDVSTGASTFSYSAKAGAAGVDFTSTQPMADFVETVTINSPDNSMPFPIVVKAPKVAVDFNGAGVRSKEILDLVAFFVANSDEEKIKANQAEMKKLMLAALPLWQNISGAYGFTDLSVPSPLGEFGARQAGFDVRFDGIGTNGTLNYAVKIAGLKVPQEAAALAPAWAVSLVPTDMELNFGGANLNLDAPARKAIGALDLTKEPPLPDEVGQEIEADFMANLPRFAMARSFVKNADTEIAAFGEMSFPEGNTNKPDVSVTFEASGYDKLVEALQNAAKTDPDAQQAFPVLLAAKGFAKTLPDGKLQWVLNVKPDGSVIVNGATMKGPDVEPEPEPEPVDPNAPPGTLTSPPKAPAEPDAPAEPETPSVPTDPNAPPGTLTKPSP